jgi:hypothetical protein
LKSVLVSAKAEREVNSAVCGDIGNFGLERDE